MDDTIVNGWWAGVSGYGNGFYDGGGGWRQLDDGTGHGANDGGRRSGDGYGHGNSSSRAGGASLVERVLDDSLENTESADG